MNRVLVTFPRFVDIYAEARVGNSYGRFEGGQGKSFRKMLERAFQSKARIIPIATWNDWGEGTMIEPSHEFGYRDLETVLQLRRQYTPSSGSASTLDHLRLPARLFQQRRKQPSADRTKQLDQIASLLANGKFAAAAALLP
ncbi:MAG: glycoside hydrolase family 99-like domain-containing protein [Pirellulales bacterium]